MGDNRISDGSKSHISASLGLWIFSILHRPWIPQGVPSPQRTAPLAVRMRPTRLKRSRPKTPSRRRLPPTTPPFTHPRDSHRFSLSHLRAHPERVKTTLAYLVAQASGRRFIEVSAISLRRERYPRASLLRQTASHRQRERKRSSLLMKSTDSPNLRTGLTLACGRKPVRLRSSSATTEIPSFSVIFPTLSRSLILTLHPLEEADVLTLLPPCTR